MKSGFRRAQLRGSEELFRETTDDLISSVPAAQQPVLEAMSVVPNAPEHGSRSIRLSAIDIEILADALQYLKFPNKAPARPSVDEFENLEELRQRLLNSL